MLNTLRNLRLAFEGNYLKNLGWVSPEMSVLADDLVDFSYGTGLNQVDVGYQGQITIVNNATPFVLDLSGTLKDPVGDSAVMAKLKVMYVRNRNTAAGNIVTWGAGSNPVPNISGRAAPDGRWLFIDPSLAAIAVTNGASDQVTFVTAAGTNILVDVAFFGTSV